jgi:type II secretory pathway component HofQ
MTRLLSLAFSALLLVGLSPSTAEAQTRGGIDSDRLIELIVKNAKRNARKKWGRELVPQVRRGKDLIRYQRMRRTLDAARVSVNFVDAKLDECLDFLRDVTGLNIVLSKEARKAYGEEEVKLRLKKVKLKSVLELLFGQLGKDLRYGYRHGVMWVGIRGEIKDRLVLRFYDVSDIVRKLPNFPAPKLGLKGLKWEKD